MTPVSARVPNSVKRSAPLASTDELAFVKVNVPVSVLRSTPRAALTVPMSTVTADERVMSAPSALSRAFPAETVTVEEEA